MGKVTRARVGIAVVVIAALATVAFWAIRKQAPESSEASTEAGRQQGKRSAKARRYKVPANPISLQPSSAKDVGGIVVEGDTPVEGATVSIRLLNQAEVAATATTGPDGRFDLGAIQWPSALLAVQAKGYVTESQNLAFADSGVDAKDLRIELKRCELGEKWTIVDSSNQPIVDAIIVTHAPTSKGPRNGGYERIATQKPNSSGEFQICKKAYGKPYSIEASGYGTYWIDGQQAVHGGLAVLAEGGTLEGVVMNSEGTPVEDVRVESLWKAIGMPSHVAGAGSIAFTGTNGHFIISDLRPGGYNLRTIQPQAFPRMYNHKEKYAEAIVRAGATTVVSLTVETRFPVSGVVLKDGTPEAVPELRIEKCDRTFSHADGSFRTQCSPSDSERRIAARRYDTLLEALPALTGPATDILVEVEEWSSVNGRVLFEGRPVANVAVGKDREIVRSDKDGNYRLWSRKAVKRVIEAWDFERNLWSGEVEVDPKGESEVTVDLELKPRGRIRGRVVDQKGTPATYATVKTGDDHFGGTRVDPNGRFEFSLLDFKEHVIRVETQWNDSYKGREVKESVTLSAKNPDQEIELVVNLNVRHFKGTVTYNDGTPVAGASVKRGMSVSMHPGPHAVADANGRFELTLHCIGVCRLEASTGFGESGLSSADNDSGPIEITIQRAGSIVGTISAPDGTEVCLGGEEIGSMFGGMDCSPVALVRDGRFSFALVDPRTHELRATVDQTVLKGTAVVEPGKETHVTLGEVEGILLSGRAVRHEDGSPVPHAHCGRGMFGGIPANSSGYFELRPQSMEGMIVVTCRHQTMIGTVALKLELNTAVEIDVPMVKKGGHLGASFGNDKESFRPVVQEVEPGGPAAEAGLVIGDQLKAIDGLQRAQLAFLLDTYLQGRPPGATVVLDIERDGEERQVQITLGRD